VIRQLPADHPDAAQLVAATEAELARRYQVPSIGRIDPAVFRPELAGGFLVAYRQERPVGCGGFRSLRAGVAELKRIYVAPEARRLGVARQLLAALEAAARQLGYEEVWLETGVEQPEALALYPACGYRAIPPFGERHRDPRSRFFGKRLDPGARSVW
jgi:GNAT superfamily N-acetyltransferase